MKLKVTQAQFEVIYQLVRHTRLSQGTSLSDEIFELANMLESKALDRDIDEDSLPRLSAVCDENEGLTLELTY